MRGRGLFRIAVALGIVGVLVASASGTASAAEPIPCSVAHRSATEQGVDGTVKLTIDQVQRCLLSSGYAPGDTHTQACVLPAAPPGAAYRAQVTRLPPTSIVARGLGGTGLPGKIIDFDPDRCSR